MQKKEKQAIEEIYASIQKAAGLLQEYKLTKAFTNNQPTDTLEKLTAESERISQNIEVLKSI